MENNFMRKRFEGSWKWFFDGKTSWRDEIESVKKEILSISKGVYFQFVSYSTNQEFSLM